jgi:hypothetical protein
MTNFITRQLSARSVWSASGLPALSLVPEPPRRIVSPPCDQKRQQAARTPYASRGSKLGVRFEH